MGNGDLSTSNVSRLGGATPTKLKKGAKTNTSISSGAKSVSTLINNVSMNNQTALVDFFD